MPSAEQPPRPHGPDASGEAPSLSLLTLSASPRLQILLLRFTRGSSPRHYGHQSSRLRIPLASTSPSPTPSSDLSAVPLNSGEATVVGPPAPGSASWRRRHVEVSLRGGTLTVCRQGCPYDAAPSPSMRCLGSEVVATGFCRRPQGVAVRGPLELSLRGPAASGGAAARALA